ncbi:MAG: hypothetical protein AAF621_05140 [Pseudomonadota bacterium]
MKLYHFTEDTGRDLFPEELDHAEEAFFKRDMLHNEISKHDLPAHISIDVVGSEVTLFGNVTTTDVKELILLLLGNVVKVSLIKEKIIVADEQPASEFRLIKAGESLKDTARDAYQDENKEKLLFDANSILLKDIKTDYLGLTLRIPALKN